MDLEIVEFDPARIEAALELWRRIEGLGLSESDEPARLAGFLERNPGFSFVAYRAGALVATVLCGHDGRRGYIHHLAVDPACRRRGIGRRLLDASLEALRAANVLKCHAFVFRSNSFGELFWTAGGWQRRDDLHVYSHYTAAAEEGA